MSPGDWEKVSSLFFECLDMPASEREAFLRAQTLTSPEIVKNVWAMLAAQNHGAPLISQALSGLRAAAHELDAGRAPLRIESYEIVGELGRGGMGTVYLAKRAGDGFVQEVAIKLIRNGVDSRLVVDRFRRERNILALLEHPYIARLLDGGSLENGMPYLVMERVRGTPIRKYCEANSLSIGAILVLFQKICEAVHYSHQRLVIHRDIKPSNILVEENGSPKLLDFGIAKLLADDEPALTAGGPAAGFTPEYASPEQRAGGVVTTASDIYSLGVVLHELVFGKRPEAGVPGRPSTSRPVPPDLVKIIRKALKSDPAERYGSAAALSSDLGRYLEGKPVNASAHTTGYLVKKFMLRHRVPIAALTVFMVGLLATTVWAVRQTAIANERRHEVESAKADLLKASESLLSDIPNALQTMPGTTATRAMSVEQATRLLDGLAAKSQSIDLKLLLAGAYARLGDLAGNPAFRNVGDTGSSLASYRHAVKLLREAAAWRPGDMQVRRDLAGALEQLGTIEQVRGNLTAAVQLFQESDSAYSKILKQNPNDRQSQTGRCQSLHDLGRCYLRKEQRETALNYFVQERKIYEQQVKEKPQDVEAQRNLSLVWKQIAVTLAQIRRFHQAHGLLDQARAIDQALRQKPEQFLRASEDLASDASDLGTVYAMEGKPELALSQFEDSAKRRLDIFTHDFADARAKRFFAASLLDVGRALTELGRHKEAVPNFEQGITHLSDLIKRDDRNTTYKREAASGYLDLAKTRIAIAGKTHSPSAKDKVFACAKENFAASVKLWKELKKRTPQSTEYDGLLARAQEGVATCERLMENGSTACPTSVRYPTLRFSPALP